MWNQGPLMRETYVEPRSLNGEGSHETFMKSGAPPPVQTNLFALGSVFGKVRAKPERRNQGP